jgi:hypothetical protein
MNEKDKQQKQAEKELSKVRRKFNRKENRRRHIRISEQNHKKLNHLKQEEGETIRYWADVILNIYFKNNPEYDTK